MKFPEIRRNIELGEKEKKAEKKKQPKPQESVNLKIYVKIR